MSTLTICWPRALCLLVSVFGHLQSLFTSLFSLLFLIFELLITVQPNNKTVCCYTSFRIPWCRFRIYAGYWFTRTLFWLELAYLLMLFSHHIPEFFTFIIQNVLIALYKVNSEIQYRRILFLAASYIFETSLSLI